MPNDRWKQIEKSKVKNQLIFWFLIFFLVYYNTEFLYLTIITKLIIYIQIFLTFIPWPSRGKAIDWPWFEFSTSNMHFVIFSSQLRDLVSESRWRIKRQFNLLAVVIAIPSDFNFSSTKENQNFDYKKITYCQIGFRKFNEYTYNVYWHGYMFNT